MFSEHSGGTLSAPHCCWGRCNQVGIADEKSNYKRHLIKSISLVVGIRLWLSARASALHAEGARFDPQKFNPWKLNFWLKGWWWCQGWCERLWGYQLLYLRPRRAAADNPDLCVCVPIYGDPRDGLPLPFSAASSLEVSHPSPKQGQSCFASKVWWDRACLGRW